MWRERASPNMTGMAERTRVRARDFILRSKSDARHLPVWGRC